MAPAICSGAPNAPVGIGKLRIAGPKTGCSSPSWISGVSTAPGATALSRTPAPAHSAPGALRRTQRARATLAPA